MMKKKKMRFTQLLWCLLLLLGFGFLAEAILDPVDFLALQAIRKSLDDLPGSNFFRSWDFTSDPCGFAGVYCDGDRVLKDLRFLAISRNFISGEIPASLGEVRRLRTLDLSYNQLTGTIPPAVGSLPELSNLILCHNHLTGSIPPFLSQTLTRIDLKRNSFTGSLSPASFPPSLQYLSLAWNQLTGPVDQVLLRLNQLNYLDLSLNRLTGTIPVNIPTVDLSYNRFSGQISPLLSSVENLYLNSNRFTGEVPAIFVERLLSASIQTLYLQHNFLTGIQISPAAEIPASSSLCLQYNCMVPPIQTPCPLKAGPQKTRPTTQCNEWRG
ncbi:hypothetical protein HID58_031313 [Brassica napus]|uniref:Leucine-rich repeat-containing N-terminal plant-type domain-containing protein n=1 Tax=Brassica napus TaxID=3708 RepID=A0ABQ8CJB1_BRANA|nr:hypothetical protein HID58_031313 [Brassica napus]